MSAWTVPGYQLLEEIARGGQGAVFRATHVASGHEVAIKGLLSSDAKAKKRFQQEARVLSLLEHPQLLQVFETGEAGGYDYLVTELVRGLDLGTQLDQHGVPEFALTARALARIARCLQYCHEQGIVHRDLKPSNVVVDATTQRPVLVDFGLVKRDPNKLDLGSLDGLSQLSQSGSLKGTPAFMAPEQVKADRADEVGPRTDVYGLGATLYMLLCGRPPFAGASAVAVLRKVSRKAPAKLRRINPSVPADLAALAMACLAKRPEHRPRSAAAVALALEAHVWSQSAPTPAPPRRRIVLPGRGPRLQAGAALGPFKVVSELGRGGMGVVYQAQDAHGRRVAVKTLLPQSAGGDAITRFGREATALRALEHPNVVRFAGAGTTPCHWVAMEFVDGADLRGVWDEAGRLPADQVARLLAQAAEGLAHVHERGLVHRDIKPDNILVRSSDSQVFLTDLGIARDLDASRLTADGSMIGTLGYMAPEQVGAAPDVGPPADVWALGAVLYRGLTGENPFVADSELALAVRICEGAIAHPLELDPAIPPDLAALALACMQVDPARRPSAAELATALRKREVPARYRGFARAPARGGTKAVAVVLVGVALTLALTVTGLLLARRGPPAPDVAAVTTGGGTSPVAPVAPVAPATTPRPVEVPALRAGALFRKTPGRRIQIASDWLREHANHPEADAARKILVQAKLELGPQVIEFEPGILRAWFQGDGILTSFRAAGSWWASVSHFPNGSTNGEERVGDPHGYYLSAAFRGDDRSGPVLMGGQGKRPYCLLIPGEQARPLAADERSTTRRVASSPDGAFIATATNNEVRVYRWTDVLAATKRIPEPLDVERAHPDIVNLLTFAADGTLISVGFDQSQIIRWSVSEDGLERLDAETARPWPGVIAPHPIQPWVVEGLHLNRALRIREAKSGALVSQLVRPGAQALEAWASKTSLLADAGRPGHDSPICGATFSADGRRLYSIAGDSGRTSELRIWNTDGPPSTYGEWIPVVTRETPAFRRLDLSPNGRTLMTLSEGATQRYVIELWDVAETP